MSSAFIDFKSSKPCVFAIGDKAKFGVRTKKEFLRITHVVGQNGFEIVCVPVDNPKNVIELDLKTSESELLEFGLSGHTLDIAKNFLKIYCRSK